MPRFVLLYHECPPGFGQPSHWDLMLERNGALMTWRLAALPKAWQQPADDSAAPVSLAAIRLPEHRLAYLDYEGPISAARGHVTRIDRGDYELLEETSTELRVRLSGQQITGRVTISPSLEGRG